MSAPWAECFRTPGTEEQARIVLEQLAAEDFALHSSLRYVGSTDVTDDVGHLTVDPTILPVTDLASVPAALRWFVSPYGPHTPAALVHDRLVGREAPAGFERWKADRLFRHMLHCLGVPFLRRWLMWAAVALGTRWDARGWRRLTLVVWSLLSVAGMVVFVVALSDPNWGLAVAAAVAPLPAGLLWGRQWGAGVVAAYTAPWIGPPTIFGALGYGVYWVIEWVLTWVVPGERKGRPASYREF